MSARWLKRLIQVFHNFSLRQKLSLAFLVMTLAPLLFATSLAERRAEEILHHSVFERNKALAEDIAHDLDELFLNKIRLLKIMAASPEVRSLDSTRMTPLLERVAGQYPEFQVVVAADANGRQIARSDGVSADGAINYQDRDYFQQAVQTGTTAISDVLTSKSAGMLGVVLAEPIRDSSGTISGLLIFNLGLDNLRWFTTHVHLGDQAYAYAINRNGRVILHPNPDYMESMADFSDRGPVRQAAAGFTGWLEYTHDGQKFLTGYSHVPSVSWGLIVEQPMHFAMAAVAGFQKVNLLVLWTATVLAILLSLAIAKYIAAAIAKLSAATVRMAAGDLQTRLQMNRTDELGQLAANFNRMAAQLAQNDEALRQAKAELERQVAERTRDLTAANLELQRLSLSDELTCIGNRRYLDEFLEREWRRALRDRTPLAVLMLDIDHFKLYNDAYGHLAGDECLKRVAGVLRDSIQRTADFVSRYGGEEFVVVLPASNKHGALTVAEKIRRGVADLAIPHGQSPLDGIVTVSIGVSAIVPTPETTAATLLASADRALYQAKAAGRNRVSALGDF